MTQIDKNQHDRTSMAPSILLEESVIFAQAGSYANFVSHSLKY